MTRRWIAGKLHGITVTDASVDYHGSVTIAGELLTAARISAYEAVDVVNLSTGGRWSTYALPGPPAVFTLNGGGARLGVVGDRCVVMAYRDEDVFLGAAVVFCDKDNAVVDAIRYARINPLL